MKNLRPIEPRSFRLGAAQPRKSFLVLFFKKEPLSLPLACRGGDLHTWAITFFSKKTIFPVYIKGGRSAGKSPSGAGKPISGASGPGKSVPGGDGGTGSGTTGGTRSGTCRREKDGRIIHSPPIRHSGAAPGRSCRTHRLKREKCSMVPPRLVGRAAPLARHCRVERFCRLGNLRE